MTGTELVAYENKRVAKLFGTPLEKYLEEQMQLMRQMNERLVAAGRKAAFYDIETAVLNTMIVKNDDGTMQIMKREHPITRSEFGVPSVAPTRTSQIVNKRRGKYNDADLLIAGEEANIEFKEVDQFMDRG